MLYYLGKKPERSAWNIDQLQVVLEMAAYCTEIKVGQLFRILVEHDKILQYFTKAWVDRCLGRLRSDPTQWRDVDDIYETASIAYTKAQVIDSQLETTNYLLLGYYSLTNPTRYLRLTIFATGLSIRLDWRDIILSRHSTLISTCDVSNHYLRFAFVGWGIHLHCLVILKGVPLAMARKMCIIVDLEILSKSLGTHMLSKGRLQQLGSSILIPVLVRIGNLHRCPRLGTAR